MSKLITRKEAMALGLPNYFTGKPCQNGHLSERDVKEWRCLECRRATAKRTHARYADERNMARREKYQADPELRARAIKRAVAHQRENKQSRREYMEAYYAANKDKMKERAKVAYAKVMADPEKRARRNAVSRAVSKTNPEPKRAAVRNRRARLRKAEGRHTAKDVRTILERQNWTCVYCPTSLKEKHHVDHIVAISRGGTNWPSNLQCLCGPCNLSKWCKDEAEWLKERGP